MGESDDEVQDPRQVLGPVMKQFNGTWDTNGTRVRTFSTFAQCNILSDYTATARITELKDPAMLQIFMHFIQVTGPSMSLHFPRHIFEPPSVASLYACLGCLANSKAAKHTGHSCNETLSLGNPPNSSKRQHTPQTNTTCNSSRDTAVIVF
ncbi:hypothetical protein LB505_001011 [Fusarium chuoi]|nr:hypothetical protein LB505_001011 [Fusarium chuoi]